MRARTEIDGSTRPTRRPSTRAGVPVAAVPVIVVLILAIGAIALVGLFSIGNGSPTARRAADATVSRPAPPPPPPLSSTPPRASTDPATDPRLRNTAAAWVERTLPHGTVVLADEDVSTALGGHYLRLLTSRSVSLKDTEFVVATPALLSVAEGDGAVRAVMRRSVPVARFATPDPTVVRQVTDTSSAQLAAEASIRSDADRQLLTNSSVRVGAAAAKLLHEGNLDLRPASIVALLAADGPVEIVRVNVEPGERAAGRPARSLDLRTGSTSALRRQLDALSSPYRVAGIRPLPDGSTRVTWPVDVTPVAASR